MNISVRQLKAFQILAEEHNFTRAAQRVHLTKPAFSALIQSLESSLGVRPFDRSTRRVELTPEGLHFQRAVPRLLQDLDSRVGEVREVECRRRGRRWGGARARLGAG